MGTIGKLIEVKGPWGRFSISPQDQQYFKIGAELVIPLHIVREYHCQNFPNWKDQYKIQVGEQIPIPIT